ncbi:hypothetical protein [Dielma fastidiosa]|uniref:hypothetical protein n=1 Tax=Dielma fastidiosa TaxID=1034346 RepID=UPI0035634999
MIKRLLLCSVFIFSLFGCNNKAEDSIFYNVNKLDDISYLAYYDEPVSGGRANHFVFLDSTGEIVKEEIQKMGNKKDIFYYQLEKEVGIFYMFGNGGLFQIDLNTFEADKLSDSNINVIDFREDELIYYLNSGFTEDGAYLSKICTLSQTECIDLEDAITTINCPDQICYIGKSWKGNHKMAILDQQDISVHNVSSIIYDFTMINDQYYAVSEGGFIPVDNPSMLIPYVDEAGTKHRIIVPEVLDNIDNTVYIDSQGTIYQAILNDSSVSIKTLLDLENTKTMPSMLEHSVTLIQGNVKTGQMIYEYNLLSGELTGPIQFNLDRFYHVVRIK